MNIKFELKIGIHNCKRELVLNVDDDTTDEELDEMLQNWINDIIDAGWSKLP